MDGICSKVHNRNHLSFDYLIDFATIRNNNFSTNALYISISDSYSDNTVLSNAARKLENELDHIINAEEQKRTYV